VRLAIDVASEGILGRIRLVCGETILAEAEACCRLIVDLYLKPNMTDQQVRAARHVNSFRLRLLAPLAVSSFKNLPLRPNLAPLFHWSQFVVNIG
jgi:hypothetical protein